MKPIIKLPSAWIPIAMSSAALALVLVSVTLFGVHQADEGAGAHIWQLLMAGQLPFIAFFALKYLPKTPKPALVVLSLQLAAGLAACAPVYYFKL